MPSVPSAPVTALTHYVELYRDNPLPNPSEPFGPGYDVLFDDRIQVDG